MSRFELSRRALLRGVAGGAAAAVALPVLDAMLGKDGKVLANGAPLPVRLGVFFWGNGVRLNHWLPAQTGTGWQLTDELQPFVNVKDYVSVLHGFQVMTGTSVAHISALVGILSGAAGLSQGGLSQTYQYPTLDIVAAQAIGGTTRFKTLEFGVSNEDQGDYLGTPAKALSNSGPNSPNYPQYDPVALYDRIFGSALPDAGAAVSAATLAVRKSVLDVVRSDIAALQGRLGAVDRQRLEQHLQGVRDLESQLSATSSQPSCGQPSPPGSSYPPQNGVDQWQPLAAAQNDLLAFALACDQTRVFTYRFSPCNDGAVYPGGIAMHDTTHVEPGDQPMVQSCVSFSMTNFAQLLERLAAMPEGTGSVLDNVAIFGFSEVEEGFTHANNPPMLVAGRAGGKLVHPGIYYEGNSDNVSRVPLTLLQAVGTGITSWGYGAGQTSAPVSQLLA